MFTQTHARLLFRLRNRFGLLDRSAAFMDNLVNKDRRRQSWLCYLCAILIGIAFVLSIFPRSMLLSGVVGNVHIDGDMAQHVVGQRDFFQDDWHWPLLMTTRLNAPDGINIAMTDSNPFIALPLKLFRHWLPRGFSAVQLWLAFAYLLQPVGAVFALRQTGERRLIPALAISVLAISMPSFLYRHTESALSSHFLLFFAIGSYFRTVRCHPKVDWLPPVLLVSAFLIHPYLAFMTFGVLAAAPLTLALRGDRACIKAGLTILVSIALTVGVASFLGYAAAAPAGGFGASSMNAISPFYPYESRLFGRNLPFIDATGSQYEGYQYLGAGLLLLSAVTFTTMFFSTRVYFARLHVGLALACLAFTALALSNVVYIGTYKFIDLEPIPSFMNQLRSSGRLFWPVGYTLLVGCVAVLARLVPGLAGSTLLLLAALLQFNDAHNLRKRTYRDLHAIHTPVVNPTILDTLLRTHSHLTLVPAFGCGADANAPEFLQILLYASMHDIDVNTVYVGRFSKLPDCLTTQTAEAILGPGELRIFLAPMALSGPTLVPGNATYCRQLDVVSVCTLQVGALAGLPGVKPPSIDLNKDIAIGIPLASPILGTGWYTPEPNGVWSIGKSATIVGVLTPKPKAGITLHAELEGFTGKHRSFQQVKLSVNGHPPLSFDVPDRAPYSLQAAIPQDQLVDGPQVFRFDISHPVRPSDVHVNSDTRQLGIFLSRLRIEDSPAQ